MKTMQRIAVALSFAAWTTTGAALAEPLMPPVGTLVIPSPFGSLPVATWSWGASNTGSAGGGDGGGIGKATIQDLSVMRFVDAQSPLFFKGAAVGQRLQTVTLIDGPTTVSLTDVLISGYSTKDSPPGNNGTRTETITFTFAKVDYAVNGVSTCFNFTTNTAC